MKKDDRVLSCSISPSFPSSCTFNESITSMASSNCALSILLNPHTQIPTRHNFTSVINHNITLKYINHIQFVMKWNDLIPFLFLPPDSCRIMCLASPSLPATCFKPPPNPDINPHTRKLLWNGPKMQNATIIPRIPYAFGIGWPPHQSKM